MPRALSQPFSVLFLTRLEPAVGVPLEEVQEQQRLAEAVGGLHQLQPLLLQDPPGDDPLNSGPPLSVRTPVPGPKDGRVLTHSAL